MSKARKLKSLVSEELSNGKVLFTVSLKTFLVIFGVLGIGGGTTFGFVRCASVEDVAASETRLEQKVKREKDERITEFVRFDARLEVQEQSNKVLKEDVKQLQKVQIWGVADQAAERVSKKAPKYEREKVRIQLMKWNIERLEMKPKKMPCMNLDCTN